MSDQDSFIREVTEEVRADRMFRLWKRYGPFVIGGIVAIVGAAAIWAWLEARAAEAARERGGAFLRAEPGVAGAEAVLAELDGPSTTVARLALARAQSEAGEREAALETYRSIAEDARLPRSYADLAALEAARIAAPGLPLAEAEGALAGITAEGAPYRALALELRAALRLNAGDRSGAVADLRAILETPGLTRSLNIRARQMLAVLGAEATDPAGQPATELPEAVRSEGASDVN
ncbi:MAG: hypothetical protein ACFBRM_08790 [Pikeienuella sp.]